jgi:hypothetical protein
MTIFANKVAFTSLGLEPIAQSATRLAQDCFICKCAIAVTATAPVPIPSPACASAISNAHAHPRERHHTAVRILACGHVHGADCLDTWLDIGNSCPSCRRMLFEAHTQVFTQNDIQSIMRALAPRFGATRVVMALGRIASGQIGEQYQMRTIRKEAEMARDRDREEKARNEAKAEAVAGENWMLSDEEEMNFEFDDEEDEDVGSEFADEAEMSGTEE